MAHWRHGKLPPEPDLEEPRPSSYRGNTISVSELRRRLGLARLTRQLADDAGGTQQILRLRNLEGEFRKHMTDEEIEQVIDIWQQTGQRSFFHEILKMIAAKRIRKQRSSGRAAT
jgi:hypothetical protein